MASRRLVSGGRREWAFGWPARRGTCGWRWPTSVARAPPPWRPWRTRTWPGLAMAPAGRWRKRGLTLAALAAARQPRRWPRDWPPARASASRLRAAPLPLAGPVSAIGAALRGAVAAKSSQPQRPAARVHFLQACRCSRADAQGASLGVLDWCARHPFDPGSPTSAARRFGRARARSRSAMRETVSAELLRAGLHRGAVAAQAAALSHRCGDRTGRGVQHQACPASANSAAWRRDAAGVLGTLVAATLSRLPRPRSYDELWTAHVVKRRPMTAARCCAIGRCRFADAKV